MSGASLSGRKVAGISGPGQSVEFPSREGKILGEFRSAFDGQPMVSVMWDDGSDERFGVRQLHDGGHGIGVYLVPLPLTGRGVRWLLRLTNVYTSLAALERAGDLAAMMEVTAKIEGAVVSGGLAGAVDGLAQAFERLEDPTHATAARQFSTEYRAGKLTTKGE